MTVVQDWDPNMKHACDMERTGLHQILTSLNLTVQRNLGFQNNPNIEYDVLALKKNQSTTRWEQKNPHKSITACQHLIAIWNLVAQFGGPSILRANLKVNLR